MSEYIIEHCVDSVSGVRYDERREEIVRCRDCLHVNHSPNWKPDKRFKPRDLWLCEAEWCMGFDGDHPRVEPNGFCAWGARLEP